MKFSFLNGAVVRFFSPPRHQYFTYTYIKILDKRTYSQHLHD